MFEALLSFLAAATYNKRLKTLKDKEQVFKELKDDWEQWESLKKKLVSLYVDYNLEEEIQDITPEELYEYSKQFPSYDKDQEWTIGTNVYGDIDLQKMGKRIALAMHGKVLFHDLVSGKTFSFISVKRGKQYGREVYDYKGQMKHELLLFWEQVLHENGFPYDLIVSNCFDFGGLPSEFNSDYSALARCTDYKYGNSYRWNLETKKIYGT